MSGFDYSKFDKIGDEEEIEEQDEQQQAPVVKHPAGSTLDTPGVPEVPNALLAAAQAQGGAAPAVTTVKAANGRYVFRHEGRTIYEWEQSLEEVNIYLTPPPQVPSRLIEVKIAHRHLSVGLRGSDSGPFLDEDTWGGVKVEESMWTLVDGEMYVARRMAYNCVCVCVCVFLSLRH